MAVAPLVILKRRRIGAIAIIVGIVVVVAGMFLPLAGVPAAAQGISVKTPVMTITAPNRDTIALLTGGESSGLQMLRHTFDHPLLNSGGLGSSLVDIAQRGGIILIVLGVLAALAFNVLPLMRGLVGVAGGIGLMGSAIELGVVMGQGARTQALCSVACHVDLRVGIWVIIGGFALIVVGGAVGALRPLAGLVSAISFTITGAVLGAGIAFLIIQQRVLDIVATTAATLHR